MTRHKHMAWSTAGLLIGVLGCPRPPEAEPVDVRCSTGQASVKGERLIFEPSAGPFRCEAAGELARAQPAIAVGLDARRVARRRGLRVDVQCGEEQRSAYVYPGPAEDALGTVFSGAAAWPEGCKLRFRVVLVGVAERGARLELTRPRVTDDASRWLAWSGDRPPARRHVLDGTEWLGRPPLRGDRSRAVALADALLEDARVAVGGFDATPLDLESPKLWSADPYQDANWKAGFLALDPLRCLVAAGIETGEARYFEAGMSLVERFAAANPPWTLEDDPRQLKYLWYDHGTATRLENLLLLWEAGAGALGDEEARTLLSVMQTHAAVLASPGFYAHNQPTIFHNHAVFQDRALLAYCLDIPEDQRCEEWRGLALRRLERQLDHMLTPDGVHVEHSPSYHLGMFDVLRGIAGLFAAASPELSARWQARLAPMLRFAGWILQPDGDFPLLGDSGRSGEKALRLVDACPSEPCRYMLSRGRFGVPPTTTSTAFSSAGYAIFRSDWDRETFSSALHLVFAAAFNSVTHKHRDELSFVLRGAGVGWLVDAGLHTYESDHPLYEYARSVRAHNGVAPIGAEDYSLGEPGGTGIVRFLRRGELTFTTGENRLFDGAVVRRSVLFVPPHRVAIFDHGSGAAARYGLRRWLHFGPDVDVEVGTSTISAKAGSARLHLRADGRIERVPTRLEAPAQGWHFPDYRQKVPVPTVRIDGAPGRCVVMVLAIEDREQEKWSVGSLEGVRRDLRSALEGWKEARASLPGGCFDAL